MTLLRRISELEKTTKKSNSEEMLMTVPISADDLRLIFELEQQGTNESKLEIENILVKYEGLPLITLDEWESKLIIEKMSNQTKK
ncbi:hypothetical protein LJR153_007346 [Paenibacillus sp. LjRoot153]|uniref:hypothetical protein n=1 Tax=Paenibacillus sp. LjRoot153 TaxID=3342270 RepID=UPI003ECED314